MTAGAFLNVCRFTATSSGTGDFVVASAVTGYQTPASASAVSGTIYSYRAESADLSEWEIGEGAYTSGTTTLARTTVHASTNAGAKVNFSAAPQVAIVALAGDIPLITGLDVLQNASLSVSAAAGALTIALKDALGNDPSAASPISIGFRNATGTTGTPTTLRITGATSLVISSGSTLGVTSSTAFRLWVVGFNDGGTFRLGVINCANTSTNVIYPLTPWVVASSTAEGGAGGADSAGVFYTGTAVTSKAYRILGYLEWSSSGLTAGTWATTNLIYVQSYGPEIPLPGTAIRAIPFSTTTRGTASTSTSFTATGVTLDGTITLTSAANGIRVMAQGGLGANTGATTGNNAVTVRVIRGTSGNTQIGANFQVSGITNLAVLAPTTIGPALDFPNTASSQTYSVQIKTANAATDVAFPYGDTANSNAVGYMLIEEVMA